MMRFKHVCTPCLQGSLRAQLDMKREGLKWAQRAKVALCAARGLAYLHDQAEPPVSYSLPSSLLCTISNSLALSAIDVAGSPLRSGKRWALQS